jgi:ribonuclease P protein subunit POP4
MKKELYALEYIGLKASVVKSPSKNRIGIEGKVVDETKNTFVIEKKDGNVVNIPKANTTFRFWKGKEKMEIEGNKVMYRPEERTKKIFE